MTLYRQNGGRDTRSASMRRASLLVLLLMLGVPRVGMAQFAAPAVPPSSPVATSPPPAASSVFDKEAAAEAQRRQTPAYIESILVIGVDPDARKPVRKTLEQRFADSLNGPPQAGAVGIRSLDTTPCMSLPSTWNNIGSSFAPMSGCPR